MSGLPEYAVTALRLGTMTVDQTALTLGHGAGEEVEIPVWGAAIQAGSTRMIVDTGFSEAERWNRRFPCSQDESESLSGALSELGWACSDVDFVVNSHLHFDHAGNNRLFTNAEFVVSACEWDFAHNPVDTQAWSYDFDWTDECISYLNYRLIGADHYDLQPGIRIIQTPGHTPGHQSVLVNTADGVLCVAGDAACVMDNFKLPTPPGVVTDVPASLASLRKISRLADTILMNHDPSLTPFQDTGFPSLRVAEDSHGPSVVKDGPSLGRSFDRPLHQSLVEWSL